MRRLTSERAASLSQSDYSKAQRYIAHLTGQSGTLAGVDIAGGAKGSAAAGYAPLETGGVSDEEFEEESLLT